MLQSIEPRPCVSTNTRLKKRCRYPSIPLGNDPKFLVSSVHVLPDDDLQLDLETYSGRHAIAYGTSLSQMVTDAEETLFQIGEVLQELGVVV